MMKRQFFACLKITLLFFVAITGYSQQLQAAPPLSAQIWGYVFEDINSNGVQDPGEVGISGVTITLSGPEPGITETNIYGIYAFLVYSSGEYTVTETDPSGYASTTPNKNFVTVAIEHEYRFDFGDILRVCDVPGHVPTIQAAVNSTCETINLKAAVYVENITIDRTLTIQGQGPADTVVDGDETRVFYIGPDGVVTLSGITIQNGVASGTGRGGGIQNFGDLTLNNLTITGNQAYNGGGIANDWGSLVINNSTIHHNSTTGNSGAGIISSGPLTITNTTISDNWTTGEVGAGGGIGVFAHATTLINCTIVDNDATFSGGGIYINPPDLEEPEPDPAVVNAMNTIIADNTATTGGADCSGTINSLDYILMENTDGCIITGITRSHEILGKDPRLGPLQDNGGQTLTRAIRIGSPAIDAGSCPETTADQRGFPRPIDLQRIPNVDDGCDIGAFEAQFLPPGLSWLMLLLD